MTPSGPTSDGRQDGRPRPPGPKSPSQPPTKPSRFNFRPRPWWLVFLVVLALNYLLVSVFMPATRTQRIDVPYSFFREQVAAGNVVEVTSSGDVIQGTFKTAVTYPADGSSGAKTSTSFETVIPSFADPGLETLLEQNNVIVNANPIDQAPNPILTLLLSFGPSILLIAGFIWLSNRASSQLGGGGGGGGVFGIGRSRARRYDQESNQPRITFDDVAGIDEAKGELAEIVDFLKEPAKYTRLGGEAPKGVLLVGAPGTGKTLLARAVAGEANVPFFSIGASEFVEIIVGVGASRVRDLFKNAREAAPAIIFIDELDAIGRARGAVQLGGSNSEQEQTLNQILTEMDGFSSREGVIVLAATNRPDVLDPGAAAAGPLRSAGYGQSAGQVGSGEDSAGAHPWCAAGE